MGFLKDEEKQILLDRYFEIEWSDDVADHRCVRCHRVAINHKVSSCQHVFCNNCSQFYSHEDQQTNCPQCQERITKLDDIDFDFEVKIHQLVMFCPNKKYGCKHKDQLRKITTHLSTCVDTREAALRVKSSALNPTDNANVLTDNNFGQRLSQLEKKVDDMDSKINVLTASMTNVTKEVEGIKMASKKYATKLQSIKSLLESLAQRIPKNESLQQQTIKQTSSNVEMDTKKASMTQEIKLLQNKKSEELKQLKTQVFEWTIKDVSKTILDDNWTYETEAFQLKGYKYDIKAKLEKKEGKIAINLQFKDGDAVNEHLNDRGFTKVKYIIRDQENIKNKKDIINEANLSFYDCFAHPNWLFGLGLTSAVFFKPYERDDMINIVILFEPPSIDRSFVSNNGILTWTVDNYKTRKLILSPSFYTSPQGFRVKIKLFMYYSKPMSVEVHFLTGQHDDKLPLFFPHKTTVTLYNQFDPSKNLVKSEQRKNVIIYAIPLESSKLIEEGGFIKDDSLLLKVVIEPEARK